MQRFLNVLFLSWSERVSIWSVPKDFQALFFGLFSGFNITGFIFILSNKHESLADLFGALAAVPLISASLSIVLIEISFLILIFGGGLMVMASWLAEKMLRWEQKRFENKIDKTYGEGTVEKLNQAQDQQSDQQPQTPTP